MSNYSDTSVTTTSTSTTTSTTLSTTTTTVTTTTDDGFVTQDEIDVLESQIQVKIVEESTNLLLTGANGRTVTSVAKNPVARRSS